MELLKMVRSIGTSIVRGEAFDFLAAGESLTLNYTLTVTDGSNATDTQNVAITILGTNDVPLITGGPDAAFS